ncbi:MAG: histidine phosphatase family protein [Gordonia sp. (in: high G+C Gram-positive bacteria)]|uniref:histidine phosphatase family protein n=1 Tax=Gordonia TaxID=2053 RepID=UPI00326326A8
MVAARTAPNRAVQFGGEHDHLDERGRRDAAALVSSLRGAAEPTLVGPEPSVVQTAAACLPRYAVHAEFASLDVGRWRGRSPESIEGTDLAAWFTDPDWRGHGGESVRAFIARIRAAVVAAAPGTLVVAGPVAQALLSGAPETYFAHDVVPGRRYVLER